MNDLETQRQENIRRNKAQLDRLGILFRPSTIVQDHRISKKPASKRRKIESLPPSRTSARLASVPVKPVYLEDDEDKKLPLAKRTGSKIASRPLKQPIKQEPSVAAIPLADIESIRGGWTSWESTGSAATRDPESTFHFADEPTFLPNKSPEEMLREGCFGGSYFRPLYSKRLGATVENDFLELPHAWFEGLDINRFLVSPDYDPDVNKYKVKCGQSIEEWEAAGWIDHRHDIRGWFQWYCRFFIGRRCEDDDRQISRWKKCVGETGRWKRALLKKYRAMGVREVFDDGEDEDQNDVSPVMHQTCFQWAYE